MAATDQRKGTPVARVATPKVANSPNNSNPPQGISDMNADSLRVVGGRIRVTLQTSASYEGIVFAACPITNLLAINTAPGNGAGDFHVIPVSQISNYQILAPGSSDGGFASLSDPSLAIGKIDVGALRARENEAIAKLREQDANKGKGVTKEAQEIFDWFKRTLPTRWDGQTIVVNDAVLVSPPYAVENCRAPKDSKQAEGQIKRVLEGYYQKRKAGNSNTNTAANSGVSTPVGGPRTVVPALPRKGG